MSDNIVPFSRQDIEIGGPVSDASVSLNLYGTDLDPDEISRLLSLAPTRSHRRGDRLGPDSPPRPKGAWTYAMGPQDGRDAPDIVLGLLLDRLPTDPSLWASLRQRFEMRLFFRIGVEGWNKGFDLSARNIQRVAALQLCLDFDLYEATAVPPELERLLPA